MYIVHLNVYNFILFCVYIFLPHFLYLSFHVLFFYSRIFSKQPHQIYIIEDLKIYEKMKKNKQLCANCLKASNLTRTTRKFVGVINNMFIFLNLETIFFRGFWAFRFNKKYKNNIFKNGEKF